MAIKRITDAEIRKFIRAGTRRAYRADDNLYLNVAGGENLRASWVFRYMADGKPRTMGLGPYSYDADRPLVTLEEARERAWALRRKLKVEGQDPLDTRREQERERRAAQAKVMTFKECAEHYYRDHRASWKNKVHAEQFPSSMKAYVYDLIGDLPVGDIDTEAVLSVLRQKVGDDKAMLWHAKPETASRVRQRIERVLSWAKVDGRRDGENPACWRGHLEHLLPARAKLADVRHHTALPYAEIGDFMAKLRACEGLSASALELTILTALRTGEVLGARWGEFDLDGKVWTVPAERMKAKKEHRVPLSDAAAAVLETVRPLAMLGRDKCPASDAYVFPGQAKGKPLSNMAMLKVLERMGGVRNNKGELITVHGFRSTFRDWAAETSTFPNHVVEMALAHTINEKVEAAYRRGDLFERRRELMAAWANACTGPAASGKIKPLFEKYAA